MRNNKTKNFSKPPFALKKSRVQLEKLEERLLLSAEPLLQIDKSLSNDTLTADNVMLQARQGQAVDPAQDPQFTLYRQDAEVIDLSRGIEQNSNLLSWETQNDLMTLSQSLNSLVLDLGAGSNTVKVSQETDGRIRVAGDDLYDIVFAKPVNLFAIRGGAGLDQVIFDTTDFADAGLSVEAETIELRRDQTVTAGGDVVFEALSRITQQAQDSVSAQVSTLVDLQGSLVTKGLVTLSARSAAELQVVRSGASADLALGADVRAMARIGESASVSGAGLRVSAQTDVLLVAELSGVESGTLELGALQSSQALVLGNAQIVIAAKLGDASPQVLVEAAGTSQLRGVVGMASQSAEDDIDPTDVRGLIQLDRSVQALVGDGLQTLQDGQLVANTVNIRAADGKPAPTLSVVAYSGDRAGGGIYGELVSSPLGQQSTGLKNRVAAGVNGSVLDLSRLDVLALDRTSVSSKARIVHNRGDSATAALLSQSTVNASGNATLVALDESSWLAEGGAYAVNFTGDATLGQALAGNEVAASVSARIESSTVLAADLRALAKGAQSITATVKAADLGPTSQGQLDEWVDIQAQRAWNQLNGGVKMEIDASTLALTGGLNAGAAAKARLSATVPAGALRATEMLVLTGDQQESLARNVVGWNEGDGARLAISSLGGGESANGWAYEVHAILRDSDLTAGGTVALAALDKLQLDALTGALSQPLGDRAAALALLEVGATALVAGNRMRTDTRVQLIDRERKKQLAAGGAVTLSALEATTVNAAVGTLAHAQTTASGTLVLNDLSRTLVAQLAQSEADAASFKIEALDRSKVTATAAGQLIEGEASVFENWSALADEGAVTANWLAGTVQAWVQDVNLKTSGNLTVRAAAEASLKADNRLDYRDAGGSALAFNRIGKGADGLLKGELDDLLAVSDLTSEAFTVSALVKDGSLNVGANLAVRADLKISATSVSDLSRSDLDGILVQNASQARAEAGIVMAEGSSVNHFVGGLLSVDASDSSEFTSTGSLAQGGLVATGSLGSRNEVRHRADAKLDHVSVTTGAGVRVKADGTLAIDASLKGKISGWLGAGGSVMAANDVTGGVTARVQGGRIDTAGDLTVEAANLSRIKADNQSSVSGGGAQSKVLAFNGIGWDGLSLTRSHLVNAASENSGTELPFETLAAVINMNISASLIARPAQ